MSLENTYNIFTKSGITFYAVLQIQFLKHLENQYLHLLATVLNFQMRLRYKLYVQKIRKN